MATERHMHIQPFVVGATARLSGFRSILRRSDRRSSSAIAAVHAYATHRDIRRGLHATKGSPLALPRAATAAHSARLVP